MQSPTDIAGGSRIPKSQHGQRMTFHLPVLTFLYADPHYVPHRLHMPLHDPVISCKSRGSYGAHVLDHLAADGAGFTGGEVAIVAVLEVDANLRRCFHLELVHSLASLGDVDVVAVTVRHFECSPSFNCGKSFGDFLSRSLTGTKQLMSAKVRLGWKTKF